MLALMLNIKDYSVKQILVLNLQNKMQLKMWSLFIAGLFMLILLGDKGAIRASGLIPVIPLTAINKDTQLPICIEEQAINY